eukprot:1264648-Pleurochrysis_carterae.AAC.1
MLYVFAIKRLEAVGEASYSPSSKAFGPVAAGHVAKLAFSADSMVYTRRHRSRDERTQCAGGGLEDQHGPDRA